jgi:hypothetical protein
LAELVDAAMALNWLSPLGNEDEPPLVEDPLVWNWETAAVELDEQLAAPRGAVVDLPAIEAAAVHTEPAMDGEFEDALVAML